MKSYEKVVMERKRLAIFTTHAVQYHVPIWRRLAVRDDLESVVFYFSRHGVDEAYDPGFARDVVWDLDLLSGYNHVFLSNLSINAFKRARIDLRDKQSTPLGFDAVLLHGCLFPFSRQILQLKKRARYKIILRGEFTERFQKKGIKRSLRFIYLKWFYSKVDCFCYIGQDAKQHLRSFGIDTSVSYFSPYSIDDDLFGKMRQVLNRESMRKELKLDKSFVLLFSGKFIPRKNPLFVAKIFQELATLHPGRFKLIMLGDGVQMGAVRSLLREEIAKGNVLLPGFTNQLELGKYYCTSDLFLLPSHKDTWGVVVNEAMTFGVPCIVSDAVGCCSDLVIAGRTGYGLPLDLERWVKIIASLSEQEVDLEQMRNSASKHVESFSSDAAAKGIADAALAR